MNTESVLTSTTQRSRKRLVTTAVVLLLAVTGVLLLPSTIARLGSGDMTADSAESVRAERLLKDRFPAADPDVVLLLTPAGGDSAAARRVLDAVAKRPEVTQVHSSFTDLPVDELRAGDTGLAFVTVRPGTSPADLLTIVDDARDTGHARDVTVTASGNGVIDGSIDAIAEASLVRAELIAAPLVGLILVVVFGSLWAALMPLVAGGAAVAIAMLGLSVLARVTEVSTFALNLATAIGFGLAVDYSLFIIARWREGRMLGMSAEEARALTIRTSGRTIVFSGVTVVIAMAALLVFPGYFLKSLAYSGILTVTTVMVVTVLIVPWMLVIASVAGRNAFANIATYTGTKHFVYGFTEALRSEYSGTGIEFTTVLPNIAKTRLGSGVSGVKMVRKSDPEDIAEAIVAAIASPAPATYIPRTLAPLSGLAQAVPSAVRDRVFGLLGADRALVDTDDAERAAYDEVLGR